MRWWVELQSPATRTSSVAAAAVDRGITDKAHTMYNMHALLCINSLHLCQSLQTYNMYILYHTLPHVP